MCMVGQRRPHLTPKSLTVQRAVAEGAGRSGSGCPRPRRRSRQRCTASRLRPRGPRGHVPGALAAQLRCHGWTRGLRRSQPAGRHSTRHTTAHAAAPPPAQAAAPGAATGGSLHQAQSRATQQRTRWLHSPGRRHAPGRSRMSTGRLSLITRPAMTGGLGTGTGAAGRRAARRGRLTQTAASRWPLSRQSRFARWTPFCPHQHRPDLGGPRARLGRLLVRPAAVQVAKRGLQRQRQ